MQRHGKSDSWRKIKRPASCGNRSG
jgi:hypothetical protein